MKLKVAVALASVSLGSLVEAQTSGPQRRVTLTSTSTQTTTAQYGSTSTLQFTVDAAPAGGDLFDVMIHDPLLAVSIVTDCTETKFARNRMSTSKEASIWSCGHRTRNTKVSNYFSRRMAPALRPFGQ